MLTDRILIVDDELSTARLLARALQRAGYANVRMSTDASNVLLHVRTFDPQLLILDLHMEDADGFEVLQSLRQSLAADTLLPVLVVTADCTRESLHRAHSLGADDYLVKPFGVAELVLRAEGLLSMRMACEASHDESVSLRRQIGDCRYIVTHAEVDFIDGVMNAPRAANRDDTHSARVGDLAASIAERLGLDEATAAAIRAAAPLHDIGKVAVSDDILLKPGPLTAAEVEIVSRHTVIGAFLLSSTELPLLRLARDIALYHHERWNGTGYPRGLSSEEIPLAARIVAVADVFDALTSVRSYKPAWPVKAALTEIVAQSGMHFDPRVVGALVATILEIDDSLATNARGDDDMVLSLTERQWQREAQLHGAVAAGHKLERARLVGDVVRRAIVA